MLGWSPESTEAMLSAVLRRQQNRTLSAAPLVGPKLITHYFSKSAALTRGAPGTSSSNNETDGVCDAPDEVSNRVVGRKFRIRFSVLSLLLLFVVEAY